MIVFCSRVPACIVVSLHNGRKPTPGRATKDFLMRLPALVFLLLAPFQAHAADRTTQHTLALPGGPLALTAAIETQHLTTPDGKPAADVVTTAFSHEGINRPITFAFNGGPGAASAFLDLGAIGPWRVPLAIPVVPSQDPAAVDNADTWLPFTDLVFIDPPGTGYSRATGAGDNPEKPFLTIDGDIRVLATTIRRWLEAHGRLGAPVFLVGESYGGFRAPRLARALLEQQGIGVSGLVMISPVLDFNGRDGPYDPFPSAAIVPALTAAHSHATSRDALADAEAYAKGAYIQDLLRGPNDAAAQDRIAAALAHFTGLDPALIHRLAGRIDWQAALRDRNPGQVGSPYDATLLANDPFPAARADNSPDPALDGLRAPLTSAMIALYHGRLDWQPDGAPNRQYTLLSNSIAREWDYGHGNGRPESLTALRQYLALDPTARALVVHGLTDLVTPYFADALLLDQIPETTPPGRLTLQVFPGGHMVYTNPQSRHALQQAAQTLITTALAAKTATAASE